MTSAPLILAIFGVIIVFVGITPAGRTLAKSLLLYVVIMFPHRRVHLPTFLGGTIEIEEHHLTSSGRYLAPDIYRPRDSQARPGVIVFVPLAKEGKRDPRVTNFMKGLVRIGYAVMVPFWPGRPLGTIQPTDIDDLARALSWFQSQAFVDAERVGIVAVSYGAGPALRVAAEKDFQNSLQYLVTVGGYADLKSLIKFVATGSYMVNGREHRLQPDGYARYILVRTASNWSKNPTDQRLLADLLEEIDHHPDQEPNPEKLITVRAKLTPDGQQLFDTLLTSTPETFDDQFAKLPARVKNIIDTLSPLPELARVHTPILILHSTNDRLVPYTESLKLFEAIKDRPSTMFSLIDVFDHAVPVPATFSNIWKIYLPNLSRLVRFIYRFLSYQEVRSTNQELRSGNSRYS